jgi:hypothetical protein
MDAVKGVFGSKIDYGMLVNSMEKFPELGKNIALRNAYPLRSTLFRVIQILRLFLPVMLKDRILQ